jgi:hypothetical protein
MRIERTDNLVVNIVNALVRLSQAARPRNVGCWAEFPAFTARVAPHLSGLWKPESDGGF